MLLPNEHSDLLLHKVHCQSQPPMQRHQALLLGQSPDDNCQPVGIWHIKSVEFVANSNAQNHTSFHDTHSFQSSIFVLGHGQNITTNFEVNNVIEHITKLQSDCGNTFVRTWDPGCAQVGTTMISCKWSSGDCAERTVGWLLTTVHRLLVNAHTDVFLG